MPRAEHCREALGRRTRSCSARPRMFDISCCKPPFWTGWRAESPGRSRARLSRSHRLDALTRPHAPRHAPSCGFTAHIHVGRASSEKVGPSGGANRCCSDELLQSHRCVQSVGGPDGNRRNDIHRGKIERLYLTAGLGPEPPLINTPRLHEHDASAQAARDFRLNVSPK